MSKEVISSPNTLYYKLGCLERALVDLRTRVIRNDGSPLHLTPTMYAVLLEAARLGAAKIYLEPEILNRIRIVAP